MASLGAAQSRARRVWICQTGNLPVNQHISPLYVSEVCVPENIIDYLQPLEESDDSILEGGFRITRSFVSNILEPTPLGWIQLVGNKLCVGDKVCLSTAEGILASRIDQSRSEAWVNRQRKICSNSSFTVLPTRFQVYSANGVTFPFGERFCPSGRGRAIFYDPNIGKVGSLSLLECWWIQGGSPVDYFLNAAHDIELRMVSSPVNATQFYPGGLSVGLAVRMLEKTDKLSEPIGCEWYLGAIPVDMPKGKGRQCKGQGNRIVSISKNMSRILRHGTDGTDEPEIDLDLPSGASALVADLLVRPTFARLSTTVEDVQACAQEKDNSRKFRFDLYESRSWWRVGAFQWHTLQASAIPEQSRRLTQRFLAHATQVGSARLIAREGSELIKGRQEFHFAENHFNARQYEYLKDSGGKRGMWIILDPHKATQQGMQFRLLPNDVVVTTGVRGWIPPDCIAAIWKNQDIKYDLQAFRSGNSLLVEQSSEGAHPRPYNRQEATRDRDTIHVPLDSSDNATSARASPAVSRKRLAPSDGPTVFSPKSPSEEELDCPEADRPPSWYPHDDLVGSRNPAPKVRRSQPPNSSQDTAIVSRSLHTDNSEPFLVDTLPFVKSRPQANLSPPIRRI